MNNNYLFKALLINILLFTQSASVFPWEYVLNNNQAIKDYNNKKFENAEKLFRKSLSDMPENVDIKYNLASNLYKQKRYIESQSLYLDVLKDKNTSSELKQKVHYNLGNTLYRMGEMEPANADLFWQNSLKEYQRAVDISSEDKQAKENYQFVLEKLKKIKPPSQSGNQGDASQNNGKNNQPQQMQAYSNTAQQPANQEAHQGVTQAEAENILREMKSEEENMQSFINRRQLSMEEKANKKSQGLKKDW